MHEVLSHQLWMRIGAIARKSKRRHAAIAYVTNDLIGFEPGDLLIVDASEPVIRAGGTNAKLLVKLTRKGVVLHSCPGLHAKVLLLDDVAVIGSGNMSESSRSTLVEAAIMTDAINVVSGVASLIEQLKRQSVQLDERALRALARIKVVRRGFGPGGQTRKRKIAKISALGAQTWLVGVYEDYEPTISEQKMTDGALRDLAVKHGKDADKLSWIKWTGSGKFASKCQQGDQVIQLWRKKSKTKQPSAVLKRTPVLLRKREKRATFIFLDDRKGKHAEIGWGDFKKLMKRLGYRRKFGRSSECVLDPELADAISRSWNTA